MTLRGGLQVGIPLALLLVAAGLRVVEPPIVAEAQLAVFDVLQRLHPRPAADAPVRVVDIDDASLERLGVQWPWPRTLIAELVDRLGALGAAVIAFDVVFAEPDRTSPAQVVPLWPSTPAVRELSAALGELPDHDAVLAAALARHAVVAGFAVKAEPGGGPAPPGVGFAFGGDDPVRFVPRFPGAVVNLPAVSQAAAGNGVFGVHPDPDGVVRRIPLLFNLDGRLLPSLVMETLRVAVGGSSYLVKTAGASGERSFGESTGITHVRIAPAPDAEGVEGFTIPTDARGRLLLHQSVPRAERFVPAWQVMLGEAPAERIAGHLIFVGSSASGLADLRPTPMDPVTPGVAIHAEAAEQILLGHFVSRPDWATGAEILYLLVLGGILVALLPRVGPVWCAVAGIAAIASVVALAWHAFTSWHWLFDPVYPSAAVLLVYLAGSFAGFLRTETERRQVRSAFSHYLSPALVEELARSPERLVLGGETRELSLLFADVRGFTSISERLEPEQLTRLINRFLTPMTEVILERRGTIDKYMGDCIMAFWNAPLDDAQHAAHACESALVMLRELDVLNARLAEEARAEGREQPPLHIGIGLNTGRCCVGNMGSDQRFDYSVVGDEVNLASRLEGQSKSYGVGIVVGENTLAAAPGFAALELDRIRVKGKSRPVRIFTLLGGPEHAARADFQELAALHATFLEAYRAQEWDRAEELLEACHDRSRELADLYSVYAERIDYLREKAPGAGWDGVHTALTK